MNPFFAAIQRYINENAGTVVVLFFSVVAAVFLITQVITQADMGNKNDHERFTAEITKNTADIAVMNTKFEAFRDEIRMKMEEMNGNIIEILTLLRKER